MEVDGGSSSNTKTEKSPNVSHLSTSKIDAPKHKSPIEIIGDHKSKKKKEHKHDKEQNHDQNENKDKHKKKREHKEEKRQNDLTTNDTRNDNKDSANNRDSLKNGNSKRKDTDSKKDYKDDKHVEKSQKDRHNHVGNDKDKKKDININKKVHEKKTPEKKENGESSKEKKRDLSEFLESDTSVLEDMPKSKKKKMDKTLNESGKIILFIEVYVNVYLVMLFHNVCCIFPCNILASNKRPIGNRFQQ